MTKLSYGDTEYKFEISREGILRLLDEHGGGVWLHDYDFDDAQPWISALEDEGMLKTYTDGGWGHHVRCELTNMGRAAVGLPPPPPGLLERFVAWLKPRQAAKG